MYCTVPKSIAQAIRAVVLALLIGQTDSRAQEPQATQSQAAVSQRWLVVLCGLPGDELHRKRMTDAVKQIAAAAETVLLVPKERVNVLVGDSQMAEEVSDVASGASVCTADSVRTLFQTLGQQIRATDTCWVICLGHAQLLGMRSTFNVQGVDFDADQFARALTPIKCQQRVFLLTMPASGFWVKALQGAETVCIAATEAGPELTATEMPYALADILSGTQAHHGLSDIDEDGQLTLLDLYLVVNLEIYQRYKTMERLQTEHAQLDDNGDGIGKELQEAFLPQETEEEPASSNNPPRRLTRTSNGDGALAARIAIGMPTPRGEQATEESSVSSDAQ